MIEAIRLRGAQMWRTHRERAAEKKAEKQSDPPGVTVPAWLVRATKFSAWVATASLMYFLFLYTLDIARDRAGELHFTHIGQWVGELSFWFPYIFGFVIVAFGIPYVAKIAIPTFVSLSWRHDPTAKVWSLLIAVAVSLVVISGTFAVQGHAIMERDRDAAVAVEGVEQGRAAIQAQIDGEQSDLRDMMNNRNAYMAQAANVGAAAWQSGYIEQARRTNDPRLPQIERALGAAQAADARRAHIAELRQQLARAPAVAGVQREVVTERTGWIAQTLGWLEGARALLLSFVMDIVALIMPLIALRLEQARNRQLGMVEGIPQHPWMLEAPREGDRPISPDAMARRSAQDVVDAMIAGGADPRFAADMARSAAQSGVSVEEMYDAASGEKLTYRKGTWVRPPKKKGKPEKMSVPSDQPDIVERNAAPHGGDEGLRSAGVNVEVAEPHAEQLAPASEPVISANDEAQGEPKTEQGSGEQGPNDHSEPSESEDDLAAFMVAEDDAGERPVADAVEHPEAKPSITENGQSDLPVDEPEAVVEQGSAANEDDSNDGRDDYGVDEIQDHDDDLPVAPRALLPAAASAAAE